MQRLRQIRLHLHFARAHAFAFGSPERGQEICACVAVGDLNGPSSKWKTRKFVLRVGSNADRIEQDLRTQAPQLAVREITSVTGVRVIRLRTELIRTRNTDIPNELFEVVAVADRQVERPVPSACRIQAGDF